VNVVPFIVVLLALEPNASPVERVERMEPLIPSPKNPTNNKMDDMCCNEEHGDGDKNLWCDIDFDNDLMSEF
jgi:hypothetical protein